MDMMELRRALLQPHIKTIGGIPVLVDNARYISSSTGKWDSYVVDSNYFLTGWYDTGTTTTKSYTLGAVGRSVEYPYVRWFNNKTGGLVDYWAPNISSNRTVNAPGQFVIATVYKATAAEYFIKNNTSGTYVFKGKNVT